MLVDVSVGVAVGVSVGVMVGVCVGVTVEVFVGVLVGVLVGVSVGNFPALSGEVSNSAGSFAITINNGVITLAKMAQLAPLSLIGNATESAATPTALSVANVKTLLNYSSDQIAENAAALFFTNARAQAALLGLYEVPLTFDVSNFTRTGNAISLNSTQAITRLTNLSTGVVRSDSGGNLYSDATSYASITGEETLQNKTLDTSNTILAKSINFTLHKSSDTSAKLQFNLGAITASKLQYVSVPNITTPTLTDTMVLVDATQTLTNKSIARLHNLGAGYVKSDSSGTLTTDNSIFLTGNQSITISGVVSGSGTTSISTSLGANVVGLNHMATLAANSIIGNNTAGLATPTALTASQVKSLLAISTSDVSEGTNLYFTTARAQSALSGLYEVPLSFGAGLTRTSNSISVNATQSITQLSNFTSAGFVKSDVSGTLSIDGTTYTTSSEAIAATRLSGTIAAARMPALTGDITTTAGSVATTIGAGKVSNTMLAGSIAASKLVGNDIATVGTITSGTWNGTVIAGQYGGTGVANTGKTITLGGNISTASTLTTTVGAISLAANAAGSSLTLPASGTVATLAGTERPALGNPEPAR